MAQQFLAEIVVIATITTLVGATVPVASLRLVAASAAGPTIVPATARPDLRIFGFAALFAGVVTFIFGLAPLRQTLSVDCLANITGGVSAWGGRATAARLRTAFVATQVAVSVVLLVGAALLARGVGRSLHIDTGYVTSNLFIVQPDVGGQSAQSARASTSSARTRDLLTAVPGVEAVGMAAIVPYLGAATSSVRRDGVQWARSTSIRLTNITFRRPWASGRSPAGCFGPAIPTWPSSTHGSRRCSGAARARPSGGRSTRPTAGSRPLIE